MTTTTINAGALFKQLEILQLRAESQVLDIKALRSALHEAITPAHPVGPVAAPPNATVDCKCPPNQRIVAPIPGSPGRTQCKLCNKEHGV